MREEIDDVVLKGFFFSFTIALGSTNMKLFSVFVAFNCRLGLASKFPKKDFFFVDSLLEGSDDD